MRLAGLPAFLAMMLVAYAARADPTVMTLGTPTEISLKIPRPPVIGEGLMLRVTLSATAIADNNRVEVRLAGNDRMIASFVGFGPAPAAPVSYNIVIPRALVAPAPALSLIFLLRHDGPESPAGKTAEIEKAQLDVVPTSN